MKNNKNNNKKINDLLNLLNEEDKKAVSQALDTFTEEELLGIYSKVDIQMEKNKSFNPLKERVAIDEGTYEVMTIDSFDRGLETSIFPIIDGAMDFMPVYVEHYESEEDAIRKHHIIVNNLYLFL